MIANQQPKYKTFRRYLKSERSNAFHTKIPFAFSTIIYEYVKEF